MALHACMLLNAAPTAKKKNDADIKKLEQKAQFSGNQYLLELASANNYYLRYRNEQFPEITDVCVIWYCMALYCIVWYCLVFDNFL